MSVQAVRMPDGTVCRSGPNCRRHGKQSLAASIQTQIVEAKRQAQTVSSTKASLFPEGKKRSGLNGSKPNWANELFDQSMEVEDIMDAQDNTAVPHYRGTIAKDLNAYLRGGLQGFKDRLNKKDDYDPEVVAQNDATDWTRTVQRFDELTEEIDAWFEHEKTWDEPKLLYRAISFYNNDLGGKTLLQYANETFKPGAVIEDKAFVSTSADPDFMLFFGRRGWYKKQQHIVFEIAAKKGLPVLDTRNGRYSRDPEKRSQPTDGDLQSFEREVLLKRGTKFRVVGVKNLNFEHTYNEYDGDDGWGNLRINRSVYALPKKKTYTVVQLEQI